MPESKSRGGRNLDLKVQAEFVNAEPDKRPKAAAYAYSRGGKLLDNKALNDRGEATLSLPVGEEVTGVRVLVGPVAETPDLEDLLRRGAQQKSVRVGSEDKAPSAEFKIYPGIWGCWLKSACLVRGTLLKKVVSGGVTLNLPVCHATVDIYEVDPLVILIPKLPDWIIEWIRRVIVKHPPLPDPPDPGPLRALGVMPAAQQLSLEADPVSLAQRRAMRPSDAPTLPMDQVTTAALKEITESPELKVLAQTASDLQFRQGLVKYPNLVHPLLCWFYPWFFTMTKVGTAETDECGHFQTLFFRGCFNTDVPDLYFTARQRFFGWFEVTIYAPTPIPCHTWWNYACGTEVTLVTTSPFAITCSPCQPVIAGENWVLFTAIGNTSLKAIFGGGAPGATATNLGLTQGGCPWGGVLRPRLDFDNSLRESLGVKYYQLSWREGTSADFTPLKADVFRHYAHMVGTDLVLEPYKLGPNYMVVAGQQLALYEIPPALPPIGQWTVPNGVTDTENGEFDSVTYSPGLSFEEDGTPVTGTADKSGLFQFKLDLYDAAGNLIDIGAKAIDYYVPKDVSLTGTIHTVKANTVAQPGGGTLVVGDSLILTLHVDNNHCWAGIGAPFTPTGTTDPCCGLVHYAPGASVTMPYVAYHPHGFATHLFRLFRSATQILPGITGGVGSFSVVQTVANMMSLGLPPACQGKPACTTAAFAEDLEVYEMATDGWGTYLGYNDDDNRAFALAPV